MLGHPACQDPDRLLAATQCVVAEWAADDYYIDEVNLGADPTIEDHSYHATPLGWAQHNNQHEVGDYLTTLQYSREEGRSKS